MDKDFLIVHKSILPEACLKVLETTRLLRSGKVTEVSEAVRLTGISRSTYYKYRDLIMEPSADGAGHRAVISVMLDHAPGTLSGLLKALSDAGANILTINQSLPIHGAASVTITMDTAGMNVTTRELLERLDGCEGVDNPKIEAIE